MGTSATEGVGLEDAMKWLVDAIATNCLRSDVTSQVTKASGALQVDYSEKVAYGWTYWLCGFNKVKHWLIGSGQESTAQLTTTTAGWMPVAFFTKEVNPQLSKRPLKTNGRLANLELTSLVKEATQVAEYMNITVTSYWARWPFKSPASLLFTQQFVRAQIKETPKLRATGLCAQKPSNAENVSIWWRHHGVSSPGYSLF